MLRRAAQICKETSVKPFFSHCEQRCASAASKRHQVFRHFATHEGNGGATKVEKLLLDGIKATGPIPISTYMSLCLSHPTHGYYMNSANPVFGSEGDFVTSPEISQVFGELVGIWLISQWMNAGTPSSIRVIELGPGRGTLMQDILRVFSQLSVTKGRLQQVHLIENSKTLREVQRTNLEPLASKLGLQLDWHDHIDEIPQSEDAYTLLVAHEFFDALPFHLLQKTQEGWQEVLIASNQPGFETPRPSDHLPLVSSAQPNAESQHGTDEQASTASTSESRFRLVLTPSPTASATLLGNSSPRFNALPEGSRVEISPTSYRIARQVGELLSAGNAGGSALIVDYGDDHLFGDSFRAFRHHSIVDVFERPGECDLTVNVDFAYLKEAIGKTAVSHGPLSQADFLERMGLGVRVQALVNASQSEERKMAISDAANRLIARTGMGKEYQVMGVVSRGRNSVASEEGKKNEGQDDTEVVWPFTSGD